MKHLGFIGIFFFQIFTVGTSHAQVTCDSSYMACDSIGIDSIRFTHSSQLGDRIHFSLTSEHDFLHGPVFRICPENDTIDFVKSFYLYSGVVGPIQLTPYYEFIDIHQAGDTITGKLIVDNSGNQFDHCILSFEAPIEGIPITINETQQKTQARIYPNPTTDHILVSGIEGITAVILMNSEGILVKSYSVDQAASISLDLSAHPRGLYVVKLIGPGLIKVHRVVLLK